MTNIPHQHNPENIFKERDRIGKLTQIREIIFGAQDGLLVPLGVISSIAGAFNNNHIVIIAGISEALAGAFSMATGAYLSSQAEKQIHAAEIKKEKQDIETCPDEEKNELVLLFEKEGVDKANSEKITQILFNYKDSFTTTMIQKELGIDPKPFKTPMREAVLMGISYLGASIIPLLPYFFITGIEAIATSIFLTLLALFLIGILKAHFALLPYIKSGIQVLLIGAGSGIGGYFIGTILPHLLGIK